MKNKHTDFSVLNDFRVASLYTSYQTAKGRILQSLKSLEQFKYVYMNSNSYPLRTYGQTDTDCRKI